MFSWAPEVHIMHFEILIFFLWTPTLSICAYMKCRELILQTVKLTEVYSSVSYPSQTSCQRPNAAMQRVIMPDRGGVLPPPCIQRSVGHQRAMSTCAHVKGAAGAFFPHRKEIVKRLYLYSLAHNVLLPIYVSLMCLCWALLWGGVSMEDQKSQNKKHN